MWLKGVFYYDTSKESTKVNVKVEAACHRQAASTLTNQVGCLFDLM
jgi:hypothetical protein